MKFVPAHKFNFVIDMRLLIVTNLYPPQELGG